MDKHIVPKVEVSVAVVGLGRIGWQYHLPALVARPGFRVVAVVDPILERREEAWSEYAVKGYPSTVELYRDCQPELVVVASPSSFHADQVIEAMESGADVVVDKPAATSLAAFDGMLNTMHRTRRRMVVYQPRRFDREAAALRSILGSADLGGIYHIRYSTHEYTRRNDWQALKSSGGGVINNYVSHAVDLLLHLTKSRVRNVRCISRKIASLGDAEDVAWVEMVTEDGCVLEIDINCATANPSDRWILDGTSGGARYFEDVEGAGHFAIRRLDSSSLGNEGLHIGLAAPGRLYRARESLRWMETDVRIDDFPETDFYDECLRHLVAGGPPPVTWKESREVMRVLERCHEESSSAYNRA
jgi:scyllo-inositol 2-dehydrogenase (NADP+)